MSKEESWIITIGELHKTIYNQDQKISDLEAKLKALQNGIIDDETLNTLVREHKLYKDLETKLAEKDIELELARNTSINTNKMDIIHLQAENMELKQQLAVKEAERHEEWKTGKEWKWEWQRVNRQLEQANQDKISFAVEQLEQLKEWVHNTASYVLGDYASVYEDDLLDKIDNQIKQLKEME